MNNVLKLASSVATIVAAGAIACGLVASAQQSAEGAGALIAFRAAGDRVVATIRVLDDPPRVPDTAWSGDPIAALGYRFADPPNGYVDLRDISVHTGEHWRVHAENGRTFDATVERIVA